MYSFSTDKLPPKFDSSVSLLIIVFIVIIQGTFPFFGSLFEGQT